MGSRYLDDDVSLLLLRVNVDIEVDLPVLKGLLDRLNRVAALLVTLHLPFELGIGNKRDKRSFVSFIPRPQLGYRLMYVRVGDASFRFQGMISDLSVSQVLCVCSGNIQICEVCSASSTSCSPLI
jgi:hypothetical protein